MQIDFFYFDLQTCNRCKETDKNLREAIKELGLKVKIRKHILNDHEEDVKEFGHVVSPSIFVNGKDIFLSVETSSCSECSDLCGSSVTCRAESGENDSFSKKKIKEAIKKLIDQEYNKHMEHPLRFRSKQETDNVWITDIATRLWGSTEIISKEHAYDILRLPNVIAERDGKPVGFVMYAIEEKACEIVALYTALENQGIGTKLLDRVKEEVKRDGCTKIWLMTTNDNTQALRFYQKRGFVISAIRMNVMHEKRKLKPIPLLGNDGIEIRDEIELGRLRWGQ